MTDGRMDNIFKKVEDYILGGLSRFVAFLFFLIAIGAFYGFIIARKDSSIQEYLLIAPALLGILAYYSRVIATALFAILIIFAVIL